MLRALREGVATRASGLATAVLAAIAVLVVAVPTSSGAAAVEIDVPGRIVLESWEPGNLPNDPRRCITVQFLEFGAVPEAGAYTAVVLNHVLNQNQTFTAGPTSFPGDSYTVSVGPTNTHTFTAPGGSHRIVLGSESSGSGCNSSPRFSLVSLKTTVTNPPPTASFTWQARPNAPLTVDFDASTSTDDESIAGYAWDFAGAATGAGQKPFHTFPAPGIYQVGLTVTDNEGAKTTTSQTLRLSTSSLLVTITPAKNPIQLGVDFDDNRFTVDVEATNVGDVELMNVRVVGGLSIGPIEDDAAHKNSQVVPPEPSGVIGTLAPGQKGPKVTYTLEGLRKGIGELSALVSGFDGQQTILGTGRTQLEIKDEVLVEFRVRPVAGHVYKAGDGLRLEGSVKNLSDKRIGVVALPVPRYRSNAGNGFLHDGTISVTPDMPQGWILEPKGEAKAELEFKGIIRTLRSAVGGTAEVDYVVKAWVHNDDGTKTSIDDQVEEMQEGGYATPVRIPIAPNPPDPDAPGFDCGYGYFTCGVVLGLDNFAKGGVDLARLLGNGILELGNYELRALAWLGQMLGTASLALQGDQAALNALAEERALTMQSLVDAGAMTLQQGQALKPLVLAALGDAAGEWVDAYAHGDLNTLKFKTGQLIGENPDLAVEGLLKVGTLTRRVGMQDMLRGFAKAEQSAPVARALDAAAATRNTEMVTAIASGVEGPALAKKIPTGATLGDDALRALGQGAADVNTLQGIAKSKNLLLLFRSRSAEAARLLERGLAWWKPEAIKIKTVTDIDIRWLGGYSRKGTVQFVEPPFRVDLSLPLPQLKAAIKRDAEAWAKSLGIDDPDLLKVVQNQAELRASEWALYHDKFFDGAIPGSYQPGPWQQRGVDVAFDPTKQAISPSKVKVAKDLRKTELKPADTDVPGGRRAFDVRMEGPKSGPGAGELRFITGDTDFLAILNADGTPIMDVERRLEIYGLLQQAVGMQHGESLTFAVGAEKRAEFLRCCVEGGEAMIAIGPDGAPTAARFFEHRSILDDTVNRVFRSQGPAGDFTLLFGARQQLKANLLLWNSMTLVDVFDVLADALSRYRIFFSPIRLQNFVNGLQPGMQRNTYDRRNGSVMQPNGNGGLTRWTQGPGTPSTLALTTVRAATAQASGWADVGLGRALALGVPGTIDLLPQTVTTWSAARGATRISVASLADLELDATSDWFSAGDRIVLDPGGPNEELATLTSVGKDELRVSGLANDHDEGEMVSLVPGAAEPALAVRSAHAVVLSGSKATVLDVEAGLALSGRSLPACGATTWRLQIGLATWVVPEGRQRRTAVGCLAAVTGNGATVGLRVTPSGTLAVGVVSVSGLPVQNPLAVSFSAGELARNAEIRFAVNGKVWRAR